MSYEPTFHIAHINNIKYPNYIFIKISIFKYFNDILNKIYFQYLDLSSIYLSKILITEKY